MGYLNLAMKVEQALQSAISEIGLSDVAILTGADDATKTIPCVICQADAAGQEFPIDTGNYHFESKISVVSNASDSGLNAHTARVAAVNDTMRDDAIAATLSSAVEDFTVFAVICNGMIEEKTETQFRDAINLDVYCCASDLTG